VEEADADAGHEPSADEFAEVFEVGVSAHEFTVEPQPVVTFLPRGDASVGRGAGVRHEQGQHVSSLRDDDGAGSPQLVDDGAVGFEDE
jgi:hypothetical protein